MATMFRRYAPTLAGLTALSGVACSSGFKTADTSSSPSDLATSSDSTATTTSGTYTDTGAAYPAATWYDLRGTLVIVGGDLDPVASSIRLGLVDAALVPTCADTEFTPDGASTQGLEDSVLFGMWRFDLVVGDGCNGAGLPPQLDLGLGVYDTRLDPPAVQAGIDVSHLNAIYASPVTIPAAKDPPLWVFGVVGTAPQFAGNADAVSATPVPDGSYEFSGLYLLPVAY